MERVTEYTRFHGGMLAVLKNSNRYSAIERLATIEDILGDDYDLDRLRKLVEEDRAGRCKTLEKIVLEYQETIVPGYRKLAEKAMEERDAAVSDIETVMAYGGANVDTCQFCKNGQCYARGGTKLCIPKWRGQR